MKLTPTWQADLGFKERPGPRTATKYCRFIHNPLVVTVSFEPGNFGTRNIISTFGWVSYRWIDSYDPYTATFFIRLVLISFKTLLLLIDVYNLRQISLWRRFDPSWLVPSNQIEPKLRVNKPSNHHPGAHIMFIGFPLVFVTRWQLWFLDVTY